MGLLNWVEADAGTSKPFLKAEIVNLDMDFIDLCAGRFWGGSKFYLQLKFSIHERIVSTNGWTQQLLAPNGIHIYCKDVEEAKEIAEIICRRILSAFSEQVNRQPTMEVVPEGEVAKKLNKAMDYSKMTTEQLNRVMWKKHCRNTKYKTAKLLTIAKNRGIEARIYYSRIRNMTGWMIVHNGYDPQLLGSNYEQAIDMLQSGAFDIYRDSIINIGEVG